MFAFVHDWKIDIDNWQIQIRFKPYALLVSFYKDFNAQIQIYQLSGQIITGKIIRSSQTNQQYCQYCTDSVISVQLVWDVHSRKRELGNRLLDLLGSMLSVSWLFLLSRGLNWIGLLKFRTLMKTFLFKKGRRKKEGKALETKNPMFSDMLLLQLFS